MAELKTKPTNESVVDYLNKIEPEKKRNDSFEVLKIMQETCGYEPRMWGDSMIGFGDQHYCSPSGREVDWFKVGFAPRKQNISIHLMPDMGKLEELYAKLGKVKRGSGCFYIKKIEDIDIEIFKELIVKSIELRE